MSPRDAAAGRTARLLVVLTVAQVVLPRAVQSLTAPKHRSPVGGDDAVPSAASAWTGTLLLVLLLALCGWIVLTRLARLRRDGGGLLVVALAPWCYLALRDVAAGDGLQRTALLQPALLLAVWALRPRWHDLAPLGHLVGLTALLSLAAGVLAPDVGLYRTAAGELVAPDKVVLPWGVLVGPFTNGNNLGQVLALGLPAVLLLRRPAAAVWTPLVGLALVWTASRSSLLAAAAGLGTAALIVLLPRRARGPAGAGVLLVATGAVVALPWLTSAPGAFSHRGLIWSVSTGYWERSPLTGLGSTFFAAAGQRVTRLPGTAYHAHNEFLHVLVTGGVVLLLLLGALLLVAARRALARAADGAPFALAQLTALLVSAVLEVPFGVLDRTFLLAVTVLPLAWLLFADGTRDARGRVPAPPAARRPALRAAR